MNDTLGMLTNFDKEFSVTRERKNGKLPRLSGWFLNSFTYLNGNKMTGFEAHPVQMC